ncbi:NB-ARC domain disease resistance protein [Medicago truncatula]|uniref:NB-ARC domain disease resistance protein n=1 Tax=Medicago truncatula TaxID=3880 RepID=G7K2V0_MEDTR|nr:NB-ARC domain disease resistance protein [Medicago truncatula]
MAEAVLEVVLHNLNSLIQKKLALFLGFDQDFKSLSSLLTTIKATLEDAEEKQFTDKAIKDWLLKLKDAVHVLDDILDECATQSLEMEYKGLSHKVQSSFVSSFHPKHVAFRYKIAKKMKSIRERLNEIAEERSKFHLIEMVKEKRDGVIDWRQTTSIISQPQVFGRDGDRDKMVDILVNGASGFEDLSVYPIVGLGGLGKTTLAQLIFNHESVVKHFDLRMWVCVSDDFSIKRMTRSIIEAATKKSCDDLDLEPLQRKLQRSIKWHKLKSLLACGGKGASVLVTTRLEKVAEIMGTIPPFEVSKLSDVDCWELFKQRAFGPNEVEQDELVVIGKEILKKCGGVPLAAIALGSLLRFKREVNEWHYVKESKLWSLQDEDYVMPTLRLSYLNLPVKLRQCFAFCALFIKDERISKKFLIELWMANGLVSSNEMLDEEDIGNGVWNELYLRSFFQDIETDIFGKITSFKMHDLLI